MQLWEVSLFEFIRVTVVLGGGAAWLTGRATARTWSPWWKLVLYVVLLTIALRFIHFSLFEGTFFLPPSHFWTALHFAADRFRRAPDRRDRRPPGDARRPDGSPVRVLVGKRGSLRARLQSANGQERRGAKRAAGFRRSLRDQQCGLPRQMRLSRRPADRPNRSTLGLLTPRRARRRIDRRTPSPQVPRRRQKC